MWRRCSKASEPGSGRSSRRSSRSPRRLGPDVKVCPCKTIIPVYRQHVIAEIRPASTSRIDLGFALGGMRTAGKLVETGGFEKKDRITHRIPIESPSGVDAEVKKWFKYAYDLDA